MKATGQQASFSGAKTQDHQHPAKLPDLGWVDNIDLYSSSYLARIYNLISVQIPSLCVKMFISKSKSQFREGGKWYPCFIPFSF